MDDAIKTMAEVLSQMLRREVACGKLQYTPYAKCGTCMNSELCESLSRILQ
jgi:hypothetical protein